MKLKKEDLTDLMNGACILASGGGGSIDTIQPLLSAFGDSEVEMVPLQDVRDDDCVTVSAGAASPSLLRSKEQIDNLLKSCERAFDRLNAQGSCLTVAIETGIVNAMVPIIIAARKGIRVVDGAGSRTCMPSISMASFASKNLPATPAALAATKERGGNIMTFTVPPTSGDGGATTAFAVMMAVLNTQEFSNIGGLAFWKISGKDAKTATIGGTLTKALELGRAVREAQQKKKDVVRTVQKKLKGYILLEDGRYLNNTSHTFDSHDFMEIEFEGSDKVRYRIYAQNESLLFWDGSCPFPLAMGPDLICYVTSSGKVFSNADLDSLKEGDKIAIIGAPSGNDDSEIVKAYLSLLRSMGYGGPYVPLKQLVNLARRFDRHLEQALKAPRAPEVMFNLTGLTERKK